MIDAHHHLWDLSHCHYPWLMERGVVRFFGDPAPIQRDYLAEDLREDFADLPVVKSVHVQVGVALEDSLKETRWLQSCANASGLPNAIVAFADLTAPDIDAVLDQHAQSNAFRGVRQIVGRSAEEDAKTGTNTLLSDPAFAEGLRKLVKRNLSFDLQLTPPLMREAARVFGGVEGLKVALCHAGSPSDFSAEGLKYWQEGLSAMAQVPGVICKLSGFGMFNHNWDVDHVRPLILTAIDLFGPERIAFGSNFPVDKLYAPYTRTMRAYVDVVQGFSDAEIDAMFADNAERFYRI
ncbi:MAG: amidohydrolase family protein [Erythrobacter sp.]|nr:amidohydrolase family protein [Erythrobacter sp.]